MSQTFDQCDTSELLRQIGRMNVLAKFNQYEPAAYVHADCYTVWLAENECGDSSADPYMATERWYSVGAAELEEAIV